MDDQPFKFEIYTKDGKKLTGGAESKVLAINHLRYCLAAYRDDIEACWYLGRNAQATPQRIKL